MQRKNMLMNILSARGGGGTTYVKNIIPELARQAKGFQFTILASSKYQADLIKELSELKIKIYDAQISASPVIRFLLEQAVLPFLLKKLKCNIYYQVTESCPLFVQCPVIINARNAILFLPWKEIKSLITFLNKLINLPIALLSFRKADKIICVSKSIEQAITARYKILQNKICVVHHGVNKNFKPLKNESKVQISPYFLSVSDFMPHKNYETLINAFHIFLNKNPEVSLNLIIAGRQDEVYYTYIKNLVNKYKLEKKVQFAGSVSYKELPLLYSRADICIFPSKVEAFGIPLLEAMSSGLPIIASDIPASNEVCQDAAIYFNPLDPAELAEKIQFVFDKAKIRKELIKNSLKRSKNFSWQITAQGLLKAISEVNYL